MSGFESPNYTQVPNDFFTMMAEMGDAELRATLVMIRHTFGYHRDGFKMGLNKLAAASGLSRNGAKEGADQAEQRGTFRRTNPEAQTEAEWELMVGQPDTPPASDYPPGQPVTTPPPPADPQVRVKEILKKEKKDYPTFSKKVTDERIEMLKVSERITATLGITPDLTDRNWEKTVRQIVKHEEGGQRLESFVRWMKSGNDYNRPKAFQLAKNPKLILTLWAQAFVGAVEQAIFTRNEDGSINV